MPTAFPNGNDTFIGPSTPETTPLASAGTGNFNHHESHENMGDAIEALERNVPLIGHDHSGVGPRATSKLKQVNTHQDADTDKSAAAIHHTIGTGPLQAAAGDHKHPQEDITGLANYICTSTTRPAQPTLGMQIFETDTNRVRVWSKIGNGAARWYLMTGGSIPVVRLLQGVAQRIFNTGSVVEWQTEEEDTFGMFDASTSLTDIIIREPGLYDMDVSLAWNPDKLFGDRAQVRLLLNGLPTTRQHFEFVRGNLFTPGFVQTVDLSGKIRFNTGDRLTILASHNGFASQFLYSSTSAKMDSRLDMTYLSAF